MNLAKALAAPRKLALAREAPAKNLNISQPLGGVYISEGVTTAPISRTSTDTLISGWKANVFAYTCVKRLASAAAQALWRVEVRTGSGEKDWEPRPDDWRNKLLAYPMGNTVSAQEVFYYFGAWLAINGNGLLRKIPGGPNGILDLLPMSPKNVEPVVSAEEWIAGYNIIENGKVIRNYPADEIIHARLTDPSNPAWGYGMLEAAWKSVESDTASANWRKDLFKNGGVPPAAITDDTLTSADLLNQNAAALHLAWRRNAKDHVPMLLGAGKSVLEFGFSAQDMQIPEDRAFTRDEIVTAFGMLPSMFSTDAATYDNQDGAIRFMYENGAGELLSLTREALNLALLTKEERESDSVYINFDLSQIPFFRRQREAKIDKMVVALGSGISRNDLVNLYDLGLEDVDGGDVALVGSGLTPLSEVAEGVSSEAASGFGAFPFQSQNPPSTQTPPNPSAPANPDDEEPPTPQ